MGARDRAGKVKQKRVWAPVFLSFSGSHLMHMHLKGKLPSGLLTAKWGPAVAYIFLVVFSFLLTDV